MEILIKPNWNPQTYTQINGVFTPFQLGVPGPDNFWFYSDVNFNINDVILIKQGSNESLCVVEQNYPFIGGVINVIVRRITGTPTLATIDSISIPNTSNNLYLDGTIDIQLNIRIFDLKELKRSSTWTRSVDVPFTANNNKIFTQIFNVDVINGYNPKKKSDCIITDGGILISSGYLQIQEIDLANKIYKCVFYGDNKNLFDDIGDHFIVGNSDATKDIRTDEWITTRRKPNIEAGWNNELNHVFGLVDTDTQSWSIQELTTPVFNPITNAVLTGTTIDEWSPFLRVKDLVDSIFNKWGYAYESDFFNSTRFADLFILNKQNVRNNAGGTSIFNNLDLSTLMYEQTNPGTQYSLGNNSNPLLKGGPKTTIRLFNRLFDAWAPGSPKYNTTVHRFTAPYDATFEYLLTLSFDLSSLNSFGGSFPLFQEQLGSGYWSTRQLAELFADRAILGVKIYKSGVLSQDVILHRFGSQVVDLNIGGTTFYSYVPLILRRSLFGGASVYYDDWEFEGTLPPTEQGDEIEFYVQILSGSWVGKYQYNYDIRGTYNDFVSAGFTQPPSTPFNPKPVKVKYNKYGEENFISLYTNTALEDLSAYTAGLKQITIISDIFKMFNLYIKPDKTTPKKFLIEPRDDFYKKGKVIKDLEWDVNSVQISYLLDNPREYFFSYSLGEDVSNKEFAKNNLNRVYGDAIVQLDNDFISQERNIKSDSAITFMRYIDTILEPTLTVPNLKGSGNTDRHRYFYYNGLDDSKSGLLYKFQMYTASIVELSNGPSSFYTYSSFPIFSQYQFLYDETGPSLYWNDPDEGYEKRQSLYYEFYENEIETYADPKSHILRCKVRMNANIYSRIDFNDIYYFEIGGNPHYYILLNIDNYKPDGDDLVDMTFLSYYDYRGQKPKRDRFLGDRPSERPGDSFPKDFLPQGPIQEDGDIIMGGVATVKGAIAIGQRNVLVGNNRNIISMGSDIIVDYGVENALIFGGGYVTASNVVAFGSTGMTLSTPDTFNFGSLNPVISGNTPSVDVEGMIKKNGNHLEIYSGGQYVNIAGTPVTYGDTAMVETSYNIPNQWEDVLQVSPSAPGTYNVSVNLNTKIGATGSSSNPILIARIAWGSNNSPEKKSSVSVSGEPYLFSFNEIITIASGDTIKVQTKTATTPMKIDVDSNMTALKIL